MKIIGHRGAKGLAPENTLASFTKALEYHADELEFDLRVTADNIVVIHHNPSIASPDGTKLTISAHRYADLLARKPDLLTFTNFLGAINRRVPLLIEIKPGEPTTPIIRLIAAEIQNGRPVEHMTVGSFSQQILREVHQALPNLQIVVIERWSGVRATWRARQLQTKRINMRSWWLWHGFLRSMHQNGYQIAPYTINNPRLAQKWQPYIYGVITDRPDLFEHHR